MLQMTLAKLNALLSIQNCNPESFLILQIVATVLSWECYHSFEFSIPNLGNVCVFVFLFFFSHQNDSGIWQLFKTFLLIPLFFLFLKVHANIFYIVPILVYALLMQILFFLSILYVTIPFIFRRSYYNNLFINLVFSISSLCSHNKRLVDQSFKNVDFIKVCFCI